MTNERYIPVNYKNKKRYKTAKYPIRQPLFFTWLIHVLSKTLLIGKDYKIEKINMEGLKPPYMVLSNHMYFIDFELADSVTYPHRVNNVVNLDGYYRRPWLMELIGAIGTRKFTMDLHLVKSIRKVLERGDVLCMYPEARYSPCGISSYVPDSLGILVKRCRVPVVTVVHHGNHLHSPFWNFRKPRKVPLHTVATKILAPDEIDAMSVDEINALLRESLSYDEYRYQKEEGFRITEPNRAEGLHKILYRCPHCQSESKMASKGCDIFCTACGKRWTLTEEGDLKANEGETEFERIPDWFLWEREEVEREIERGEYSVKLDCDIYSQPRAGGFVHLGDGTLTHDPERGLTVEGMHRGEKYRLQRLPLQTNSLHIEYDWCYIKPQDCIDVSCENDSFYCFPKDKRDIVTKMAFATEIIYQNEMKKRQKITTAEKEEYA